jgi:hypothetical protein
MATETPTQQSIIDELNANLDTGFTKSVDLLFNDIIKHLKASTLAGFRVSQYNRNWTGLHSMMSPVHIGYDGVEQRSVMLPDHELKRLFDAVSEKLTREKIKVGKMDCKYKTLNKINYNLEIQIDLEVLPIEKPQNESPVNSPSHSPETNNFDFKCGSC